MVEHVVVPSHGNKGQRSESQSKSGRLHQKQKAHATAGAKQKPRGTSTKTGAIQKQTTNRNCKPHWIIQKAMVRYVTAVVILITVHNVRVATDPEPHLAVRWVKEGRCRLREANAITKRVYKKWGATAWELCRKNGTGTAV